MGLEIWNQFSRAPTQYLKKIVGGRIAGKSDINPQWRYMAMTEQFGPCGIGWRYSIERLWTEPGADGVVFAFAQVSLYVKVDGVWSESIPGVGGHKLLEDEKAGLHNNDEAYKMAVTDALGVAMKMLGVAAEVYLGNFDGSKYLNRDPGSTTPPPGKPASSGFGGKPKQESSTPPTKQFTWKDATSAERRDYVMARIAEAVKAGGPDGMAKLREISSKIKGSDFSQDDMDAIAGRLVSSEQDLSV